jgi:hypothetical protein
VFSTRKNYQKRLLFSTRKNYQKRLLFPTRKNFQIIVFCSQQQQQPDTSLQPPPAFLPSCRDWCVDITSLLRRYYSVLPPPVISAVAAAAPPLKLQSSCHRSQFCCLPRVEGWSPPIPATGRRRRLLSKNFLAATIYCETRTRASQSAANAVTMHKQESAVSCPFSKGRNVKCPRAVDKTTIGYVRGWMKHRAQEHGQDQRRAEYKSTGSEGAEYKSTGALEHWKHRNTGTVLYTEPSGRLMLCCERAVQSGKDQNTHTKSKIQNTKIPQ